MDPARSPSLSARSLSISSTPGPRTSGQFPPLSTHGMPKEPSLLSPDSLITHPHRFSGLPASPRPSFSGLPSSPRPSFTGLPPSPRPSEPPMSPMPALSPSGSGPLSPPMSGKSFGTFIDSEPSTPAYSPRGNWDDSTLVLLTPVKSSSGNSPREPKWDMMIPLQKPPKKRFSRHRPKLSISSVSSVSTASRDVPAANTSLSSHPVGTIHEEAQKENTPPTKEEKEKKDEEEAPAQNDPLGKLAFRMKALLKRRSHGEKKEKRSRTTFELDRVETVHWTEL